MAIKKQEFYEGAALHLLARGGGIKGLRYEWPFFVVNERMLLHLKYSTRVRSPWGFTFTPDEQLLLQDAADRMELMIGLVCAADGVAVVSYDEYRAIANLKGTAVRVACFRDFGEHYQVKGPDGTLNGKVAPSDWQGILGE